MDVAMSCLKRADETVQVPVLSKRRVPVVEIHTASSPEVAVAILRIFTSPPIYAVPEA